MEHILLGWRWRNALSVECRTVEILSYLTKVSMMVKESDFAGKWSIVEAMDMVDDYLNLMPDPNLKIEVNGKDEVSGSYQFGAQDGSIGGQFEQDKDKECPYRSSLLKDGMKETKFMVLARQVFESADTLLLQMHYHMGDTYSFRCTRM